MHKYVESPEKAFEILERDFTKENFVKFLEMGEDDLVKGPPRTGDENYQNICPMAQFVHALLDTYEDTGTKVGISIMPTIPSWGAKAQLVFLTTNKNMKLNWDRIEYKLPIWAYQVVRAFDVMSSELQSRMDCQWFLAILKRKEIL